MDALVRTAAARGMTGLTLWRTTDGRWQGNRKTADGGWRCVTADDPVVALLGALDGEATVAAIHPVPEKVAPEDVFG
jgi:hypothetical protein